MLLAGWVPNGGPSFLGCPEATFDNPQRYRLIHSCVNAEL